MAAPIDAIGRHPPAGARRCRPWMLAGAVLLALIAGCDNTGPPPRPTRTPGPTPPPGSTVISPSDAAAYVYIPAGEFLMGTKGDRSSEGPQHTKYLDEFWIAQTEVTNEQFARFVEATGHTTTAEKAGFGDGYSESPQGTVSGADWRHPQGPSSDLSGLEAHPVVQVSWDDARAYCEWAGGRLPSEAEWEKAARGTDGRIYPWGDTFDGTRVNYCDKNCPLGNGDTSVDDGYALTAPVGSYPAGASVYGALDMAGNVWEWVADPYYGGLSDYSTTPTPDPAGPHPSQGRSVRGGGWGDHLWHLRTAQRNGVPADLRYHALGFRCAR